jgi:predicted Zn-dependent peptidase
MDYQIITLDNGIRIIYKYDPMPVVYCGMVINAGSRDETENELGMAHFVEHMLFKGTQKRHSGHIINKLEHVGGELNAYTSKEETVVYAAVLEEHLEKAVDLTGDIIFNSIFPEKELEKERIIILDEIQSYNDSPSELIYDEFEEILFQNHPIGNNILGTPELLKSYSNSDLKNFTRRNYKPDQMVFFVLGKADEKKLKRWGEKYFNPEKQTTEQTKRLEPSIISPTAKEIKKDTFQIHYMLGNRACNLYHKDKTAMYLLNNILGGPGMNSLLNLSLREKNGLVYNVDSSYQPMTDTGMWTVYFGCDPENFKRCEKLVLQELRKLRDIRISENALKKYKMQLLGQTAIASENKENLSINMGKSLLRYGKVELPAVMREHILSITSEKLQEIANEVFREDQLSTLKYY